MNISLEELSQILAVVGISSSREEHILTVVKNLSTSPKVKEEPTFHETHISNGEKSFEPETEQAKEEMRCDLNQEWNQEYHSSIEIWFKVVTRSHHSFILPSLFVSYYFPQLVSHTLICFKLHFPNMSVNKFIILLRMWLNWKYAYT